MIYSTNHLYPSIMFSHLSMGGCSQKCVDFTTSPPSMKISSINMWDLQKKNGGLKGILSNQTFWKQRKWWSSHKHVTHVDLSNQKYKLKNKKNAFICIYRDFTSPDRDLWFMIWPIGLGPGRYGVGDSHPVTSKNVVWVFHYWKCPYHSACKRHILVH